MRCDFCSSPTVRWSYPTTNFAGVNVRAPDGFIWVSESVGGWAACDICHEMIERGERESLAERSVSTLIETNQELRGSEITLKDEIRLLHAKFFAFRTGLPSRVV
jgi:hypothetical protein